MYNPMPINLAKTYKSPFPYQPGQEIPIDNGRKLFRFFQYNGGDDNIPGLRGQICYNVVVDAANISTPFQVTCDLGSATIVSQDEFAGVIQPDVVLDGEGCWGEVFGPGEVAMWADAAITRATNNLTSRLSPGANDGTVKTTTDGTAGQPLTWFAELLADVMLTFATATEYYYASIPAGQTTTAQYIVGETVTANTDTAIVVERLRRGDTDYGLIVSTISDDGWANGETAVGGTSAASGVLGAVGPFVHPQNYRLIRN